jgi:hypothetical protein
MSFPSDLPLARSLTSSASATLIRDCNCPFERRASAKSLLIWAVASVGAAGSPGSRGLESWVEGSLDAFSASRAAVRSRSCVTVEI